MKYQDEIDFGEYLKSKVDQLIDIAVKNENHGTIVAGQDDTYLSTGYQQIARGFACRPMPIVFDAISSAQRAAQAANNSLRPEGSTEYAALVPVDALEYYRMCSARMAEQIQNLKLAD